MSNTLGQPLYSSRFDRDYLADIGLLCNADFPTKHHCELHVSTFEWECALGLPLCDAWGLRLEMTSCCSDALFRSSGTWRVSQCCPLSKWSRISPAHTQSVESRSESDPADARFKLFDCRAPRRLPCNASADVSMCRYGTGIPYCR